MIKTVQTSAKEAVQNIEALKKQGIEYALIYQYDSLTYCEIEEMKINWQTLMEARLFGEQRELHIVKMQEEFKLFELVEDETTRYLTTVYLLEKSSDFSKMQIKKYIENDEDGQAYISYVRPCKLYRR